MLLKLFAGLSAAATALNISSPRVEFTGIKLAGFALLRFAEFYIGTLLAYIAAVYAASELTVDMEKPQEKPSKFWQWNMNELAEIICVLVGARVSVTGNREASRGTALSHGLQPPLDIRPHCVH